MRVMDLNNLLSEFGKKIYFPQQGILKQSAEANGTKLNATLGQAFEHREPMVLDVFNDRLSLGKEAFLYSSSYGRKELRELWKNLILQKNPSLQTEISLPVVTNALTHGCYLVGKMFLNEGEKLIITDKFWGNYKLIFSHAEIDTFETFVNGSFNVAGLRDKLLEEGTKKVVLLNFPNNPAGYTPTVEEVEKISSAFLEAAEQGKKIIVICDDAYFGLVYEQGVYRESIFAKLAELHENILTIKLDGITKECYAWGLRVGFITYGNKGTTGYAELEDKTAGAIRATISNVSTPSQLLAYQALSSSEYAAQAEEKYLVLKERYEKIKEILAAGKYKEYFTALPYNSGYFMCLELQKNSGEEVRKRLLENYSTGVIAIGNLLRIAFSAVDVENIAELFENIYQACD